jgi:hypothetical protein
MLIRDLPGNNRSLTARTWIVGAVAVVATVGTATTIADAVPASAEQVSVAASTLCGASFATEAGETYQQALAREDGYFDGLESVRVFYSGLPKAWPGKLDTSGRPMIVSFKAAPAEVLAGTHDTSLRSWFATAPRDQMSSDLLP